MCVSARYRICRKRATLLGRHFCATLALIRAVASHHAYPRICEICPRFVRKKKKKEKNDDIVRIDEQATGGKKRKENYPARWNNGDYCVTAKIRIRMIEDRSRPTFESTREGGSNYKNVHSIINLSLGCIQNSTSRRRADVRQREQRAYSPSRIHVHMHGTCTRARARL